MKIETFYIARHKENKCFLMWDRYDGLTTDCGMSPVIYMITGPIGEQAYEESLYIASLLTGEMS